MTAGRAGGSRSARRGKLVAGDGPLARIPAWVAFLLVLAVFLLGVFVGGPAGVVLLGLLALGVAALLAVTWPALSRGDRAGRVIVLVALVTLAVVVALR